MATKKITEREMFTLIAEANADNAEIVAFCEKKIEQLDRKKQNNSKKANENIETYLKVLETALSNYDGYVTISELIAQNDLSELKNQEGIVTPQKVSNYMQKLYEQGKVEKTTIKKKVYFKLVRE